MPAKKFDYPDLTGTEYETLYCSQCETTKHFLEFSTTKQNPGRGYRDSYCRPCKADKNRKSYWKKKQRMKDASYIKIQVGGMDKERFMEGMRTLTIKSKWRYV